MSIGRDGHLHASIYDKRDDFNFHFTFFPSLSSNIPSSSAFDVYLSISLYITLGPAPRMNVLFWVPGDFPVSYWNEDSPWNAWKRHSGSFMVDTGIWSLPLTNDKWHYGPWPVSVTSQPIRLSTIFMILILSFTFTELRVVSMEHLQRVLHANRKRLPFRTPGSVRLLGTCLCSNCWDQFYRTCRVFSRLFTLNTLRYFLNFDLYISS